MTFDEWFIAQAFTASLKSKDPSTKVGCVLVGPDNEVLSIGFNGFPRGVREIRNTLHYANDGRVIVEQELVSRRWKRPAKYDWIEHAERNAVYNAARKGIALKGARAYLNFAPATCVCIECAKACIQAGIVQIVGPDRPFTNNKDWNFEVSRTMLSEANISVREIQYEQ